MKNFILFVSIIFSVCLFGDILDSILDIDSYYSELPVIEIEEAEIEEAEIEEVDIPETVNENGENLKNYTNEFEESQIIFNDQRMILHDDSIIENTEIIQKWKTIYSENKNYDLSLVIPNWKIKKVIAEAQVTRNRDYTILDENIAFYKKQNYSSILVTFDKDDTMNDVISLIQHIKSTGMNVWLAYAGNETLDESLFMDPDEFYNILKYSAPHIEAFLMCWRRTSQHLWKQDIEYVNYVCKTLRDTNANIPIFGEYYYGENSNTEIYSSVITLYKEGMTGLVITNFGTFGKNQKHIVDKIKNVREFSQLILAGQVLGESVYYLTDNKNDLTFEENLAAKRKIERKFLKAGCNVTITLQNDGKDTIQQDLTNTLYNTLKNK